MERKDFNRMMVRGSCISWRERIVICEDIGGDHPVLCVDRVCEDDFLSGGGFYVARFHECKPITQKKVVPFEFDDYKGVVQVVRKSTGLLATISEVSKENVIVGREMFAITYMPEVFELPDGKPLTKEIEE